MMTTRAARGTLVQMIDRSDMVASWDNGQGAGDLYYYRIELYRHERSGRLFMRDTGGGAMRTGEIREVDRDSAIEFVANHATGIGGWGYTREQAETLVDGGNPGEGTRDYEGSRPDAPDIYSY